MAAAADSDSEEVWATNASTEQHERDNADEVQAGEKLSYKGIVRRSSTSMTRQSTIVRDMNRRQQAFGLGLAFIAVVFIWESMDRLLAHFFGRHLALAYFLQMVISLLLLWLITYIMRQRIKKEESVSCSQNFLSLATVSSAAGSWGFMSVIAAPHLRKESSHWVWFLGGCFFFTLQTLYAWYTRHYAFTDIISCVTSLGLVEEKPEDFRSPRSPGSANDRTPLVQRTLSTPRRSSMDMQPLIAANLTVVTRITGLTLAYLAVVGLWEGLDRMVIYYYPKGQQMFIAYAMVVLVGIAGVVLSVLYLRAVSARKSSTLCAQSCVGLSNLVLAIGCWNCITTPVDMYVPERGRTTFSVLFATVLFFLSWAYSQFTRHFALLDIASCVTSLGVFDDEESDTEENDDLDPITTLKSYDVQIRKQLLSSHRSQRLNF